VLDIICGKHFHNASAFFYSLLTIQEVVWCSLAYSFPFFSFCSLGFGSKISPNLGSMSHLPFSSHRNGSLAMWYPSSALRLCIAFLINPSRHRSRVFRLLRSLLHSSLQLLHILPTPSFLEVLSLWNSSNLFPPVASAANLPFWPGQRHGIVWFPLRE
jgi:hypothetical protein